LNTRSIPFVAALTLFAGSALSGCKAADDKAPAAADRKATADKAETAVEAKAPSGDRASGEEASKAPAPAAAPGTLVVLSGRKESLIGPFLEGFTKATGVEVKVDYAKTAALAMRLVAEGERSGGDVVLAQEVGYLGSLGKVGLLAEIPAKVSEQVGAAFRDPAKRWVGVSGRMRVLVHPAAADVATLPKTLKELADPRYKGKLGWAPGNASMHAHVSVLRNLWGEAETEAWLKGIVANGAKAYPKNSPQVRAAADGALGIGWVNHYYLHKLGLTAKAKNFRFPTKGDAGNVMMVSGAAVLSAAKNKDAAWKLVEYLISAKTQAKITKDLYEYPARIGVATHPDVPALSTIGLATFDVAHLADVGPTVALLRKLGLQ
jgi:iron(III) transport system substrate-binding protein